jgi:hypothetical protein
VNRAPAALAIAVALSAPRTVRAEPCAPRAELDGDRAAVERVADELQRLGVVIAPATPSCPAVRAMVALDDGGGIAVAVRGASQRSEGRVMSDATLVAAWIDSWARDDLEVASWSGSSAADGPAPVRAPALVAPRDVSAVTTPARRSILETASIAAAYELAWTNDSTSWTGVGVSGCVRVGALCLGGRVHAAFQPNVTTNATAAARSDLSVLATASLPITAGQTIIAPELGVGLGRLATRRLEGCLPPPPACDQLDPTCPATPMPPTDPTVPLCTPASNGSTPSGPVYVGDGFDHATYSPRIAVALRVAVPLFAHVWLDGLASVSYAPVGHDDVFAPTAMPATMIPPELVALPGEPSRSFQLGIGLRVGAP